MSRMDSGASTLSRNVTQPRRPPVCHRLSLEQTLGIVARDQEGTTHVFTRLPYFRTTLEMLSAASSAITPTEVRRTRLPTR